MLCKLSSKFLHISTPILEYLLLIKCRLKTWKLKFSFCCISYVLRIFNIGLNLTRWTCDVVSTSMRRFIELKQCRGNYFFSIFLLISPENIKKQKFFDAFRVNQNGRPERNGLISIIMNSSSVIRQKGKSHNGYYKKTKLAKFSEKRRFLTHWYAHVRVRIRG